MLRKLEAVVFLHHGLGDLVMALPMLEDMKAGAPKPGRILVFVRCPSTFRLLEVLGYTDVFEVRIFNRRLALLYPLWLSLRRPRVFLAPQSCGDWRMPLLSRLVLGGISIGPENMTGGPQFQRTLPDHDALREAKSDYYRRFAVLGGFAPPQPQPRAPAKLVSGILEQVRALLRSAGGGEEARWFGFAPGSTAAEAHKRWPAGHFAALADEILSWDPHNRIAILGAGGEQALLEDIRRRVRGDVSRVHVVMPSEIGLALGIYAECLCLITGCNGPSHMAGLVGTPLVSIYGPTNPGNTGAWSQRRRVLRAGLTCSPCYRLEFLSGCGNNVCMQLVTAATVAAAARDLLANGGSDDLPWLDNPLATAPDRAALVRLVDNRNLP